MYDICGHKHVPSPLQSSTCHHIDDLVDDFIYMHSSTKKFQTTNITISIKINLFIHPKPCLFKFKFTIIQRKLTHKIIEVIQDNKNLFKMRVRMSNKLKLKESNTSGL